MELAVLNHTELQNSETGQLLLQELKKIAAASFMSAISIRNIKQADLYTATGMNWEEFCNNVLNPNFGISKSTANDYIRLANTYGNNLGNMQSIGKKKLLQLVALPEEQLGEFTEKGFFTGANGMEIDPRDTTIASLKKEVSELRLVADKGSDGWKDMANEKDLMLQDTERKLNKKEEDYAKLTKDKELLEIQNGSLRDEIEKVQKLEVPTEISELIDEIITYRDKLISRLNAVYPNDYNRQTVTKLFSTVYETTELFANTLDDFDERNKYAKD